MLWVGCVNHRTPHTPRARRHRLAPRTLCTGWHRRCHPSHPRPGRRRRRHRRRRLSTAHATRQGREQRTHGSTRPASFHSPPAVSVSPPSAPPPPNSSSEVGSNAPYELSAPGPVARITTPLRWQTRHVATTAHRGRRADLPKASAAAPGPSVEPKPPRSAASGSNMPYELPPAAPPSSVAGRGSPPSAARYHGTNGTVRQGHCTGRKARSGHRATTASGTCAATPLSTGLTTIQVEGGVVGNCACARGVKQYGLSCYHCVVNMRHSRAMACKARANGGGGGTDAPGAAAATTAGPPSSMPSKSNAA